MSRGLEHNYARHNGETMGNVSSPLFTNTSNNTSSNTSSNTSNNGVDSFVQLRRFAQRGDVENVRALLPNDPTDPHFIRHSYLRVMLCDAYRLAIWNGWPSVAELMVQAVPFLSSHCLGPHNNHALDKGGRAPCESDAFATWLINKERARWPSALPLPMTSLQLATRKGRVSAVKRLIHAKANVQGDSDRTGWRAMPALYFAVHDESLGCKGREKQTIAVIAVLLRAKATLRRPETMNNGSVRNTPLYNAVSTGQFHVAQVLIRAKADLNEDRKGTGLLERAMKTGNHAIAELLRNAGAQEAQEFKVER